MSGIEPPGFGRRSGFFRETNWSLSGDATRTFGRRDRRKKLAKSLNFKALSDSRFSPTYLNYV